MPHLILKKSTFEMNKIKLLYILVFVLISNIVYSSDTIPVQKKWFVPDYYKIQFAGNIGFISIGTGYEIFNNCLQSDILFGYVPESIGNTTVYTITQKNTFLIHNLKLNNNFEISPIIGFAISYETGNNSWLFLPDKYPDGYYSTNAFHFPLFAGAKIKKTFSKDSKIKSIEFNAEVGTIGTYLYYSIINSVIKCNEITSLALVFTFKI